MKWFSSTKARSHLPPSPPRLPIGNLHQLGTRRHRSFQHLAQKHGGLMMIHLGSRPLIIVSSADAACEILKTNDLIFSSKPRLTVSDRPLYRGKDVATAPYGDYWRKMRSICVLHLLSNKTVQSFRGVRKEEMALLIDNVTKSSMLLLPVYLSEMFSLLTNDVICRVAFGKKYSGGNEGLINFKKLLGEFTEFLVGVSVGDFIPWLSWVNRLNGVDARVERVFKELDELIRHPRVMKRLQNEIMGIANGKQDITESDMDKMPYLKAVIKETVRLYPPLPLVTLRESTQDANIKGCDIAAKTMVLFNAWTIGRDPSLWEEPEEFQPDRFMNSCVDFKGHDFQFIPFEGGRRGCPGI